jgi:hypothetical protein
VAGSDHAETNDDLNECAPAVRGQPVTASGQRPGECRISSKINASESIGMLENGEGRNCGAARLRPEETRAAAALERPATDRVCPESQQNGTKCQ